MSINIVVKSLKALGPCLSSKLKQRLLESGITDQSARKWIERAKSSGQIKTLENVRFSANQQFVFLAEHSHRSDFLERLSEAFEQAKSLYRLPVQALLGRGGIVRTSQFPTISARPTQNLESESSEKTADDVLEDLIGMGILERTGKYELDEEHIRFDSKLYKVQKLPSVIKARHLAEDLLLEALANWAVSLNITSTNKVKIRVPEGSPDFNFFEFDFVAPCYLHAFQSWDYEKQKVRPGFLVLDVVIGKEEQTLPEIEYFFSKCDRLKMRQKRPFLAILVADWFSREAYLKGREKGLILATPSNILGKSFAGKFKEFSNLVSELLNEQGDIPTAIEKLGVLVTEVSGLKGSLANYKGLLFEFIVGYCGQKEEGVIPCFRKMAHNPETYTRAEIDVLFTKSERKVRGIECKGNASKKIVTKDEVQYWIRDKLPIIRAYLKLTEPSCRQEFSYWTMGKFDAAAIEYMELHNKQTRKYQISWRDGQSIYNSLDDTADAGLRKLLKEQFMGEMKYQTKSSVSQ